jgi:hypothetical protein
MPDQLTVTMTMQEWNAVIDVLADGRYRVAGPLIQKMAEQLQAQNPPQEAPPPHLRPVPAAE